MNKQLFKTVFSKKLGIMVAVGEHVNSTGQGKSSGRSGFLNITVKFIGALVGLFLATQLAIAQVSPGALPTGASVNAGGVTTSQSGNTLNIN